ncbi:transposase for transposon Tn3 [Yersinia nurmii]|uniref:Transposase for transposon Tn3 n=1 Tax=Yersinia nurmii TaxID=685706 RepID=A0ABP1YI52_9GAMM|nr:transposase for transposon Tn3 [Yersinia nurmii]
MTTSISFIFTAKNVLDVLDGVIADIGREAKKIGQKKRVRTLKDLDKSALELANICSGTLTLGTIWASVLSRSLLSSDRPSGLTQAIIEAGKINKTLYLLNYIDDEWRILSLRTTI